MSSTCPMAFLLVLAMMVPARCERLTVLHRGPISIRRSIASARRCRPSERTAAPGPSSRRLLNEPALLFAPRDLAPARARSGVAPDHPQRLLRTPRARPRRLCLREDPTPRCPAHQRSSARILRSRCASASRRRPRRARRAPLDERYAATSSVDAPINPRRACQQQSCNVREIIIYIFIRIFYFVQRRNGAKNRCWRH